MRISAGIRENRAGILQEVNLQRRTKLEKSSLHRIPNVVGTGFKGVLAHSLGNVVPKLPLALERLLRNICVGAKLSRIRENNERSADLAGDQVVPILKSECKLVDDSIGELRIHRQVSDLKMVGSEVAVGKISSPVGLIVEAVIGLRAVAEIGRVPVVDGPVHATGITPLVEWPRNR